MRIIVAMALAMGLAGPAAADITVRFYEGAPKDRFVFAIAGACETGPAILGLDLAGSPAGLVFDVTAAGAGVEVFQPFELVSGAAHVTALPQVQDGDTGLNLEVDSLVPGEAIAFTIDLDDTIGAREITVSGSEIAGARALVTVADQFLTGTFDETATATIPFTACLS